MRSAGPRTGDVYREEATDTEWELTERIKEGGSYYPGWHARYAYEESANPRAGVIEDDDILEGRLVFVRRWDEKPQGKS